MYDLIYLVKVQTICPKCGRVRIIQQILTKEKIVAHVCVCEHRVVISIAEDEHE